MGLVSQAVHDGGRHVLGLVPPSPSLSLSLSLSLLDLYIFGCQVKEVCFTRQASFFLIIIVTFPFGTLKWGLTDILLLICLLLSVFPLEPCRFPNFQ